MVLVLVMIITISLPLVLQLPESTIVTLELIDWTIWATFALELAVRTSLVLNKIAYLRKNWVDVIVVLLPLLRIFRIFRAIRLLRMLRFSRILVLFDKFAIEVKIILKRHHLHYLLILLIGFTSIGSVLIYYSDIESNTPNGVRNFSDALWMAIVTVFAGGYENIFPATPEARGVTILLILFGTIVVSYFTASLASYFTEKEQDKEQECLEAKMDILIQKLENIEKKIIKNN